MEKIDEVIGSNENYVKKITLFSSWNLSILTTHKQIIFYIQPIKNIILTFLKDSKKTFTFSIFYFLQFLVIKKSLSMFSKDFKKFSLKTRFYTFYYIFQNICTFFKFC